VWKNFDPQLELVASAAPVVLAGDYNVVPTAADAINSAADLVPLALSLVCFPQFGTPHRLLAERLLEDVLNHSGLDFAGLVIKRGAMCVQYEDIRDISLCSTA